MRACSVLRQAKHGNGCAVLDQHGADRGADAARTSGNDPDASFER
jgi:hypothetical protein